MTQESDMTLRELAKHHKLSLEQLCIDAEAAGYGNSADSVIPADDLEFFLEIIGVDAAETPEEETTLSADRAAVDPAPIPDYDPYMQDDRGISVQVMPKRRRAAEKPAAAGERDGEELDPLDDYQGEDSREEDREFFMPSPIESDPEPEPEPEEEEDPFADADMSDPEVQRRFAQYREARRIREQRAQDEAERRAKEEERERERRERIERSKRESSTMTAAPPPSDSRTVRGRPRAGATRRRGEGHEGDAKRRRTQRQAMATKPARGGGNRKRYWLDVDEDSRSGRRRRHDGRRRGDAQKPPPQPVVRKVRITGRSTVAQMAHSMSIKTDEVIKVLRGIGVEADMDTVLDIDTAQILVEELGHKIQLVVDRQIEDELEAFVAANQFDIQPRHPVVAVMGHVDHGKTSLLDYIRNSRVAAGEAGGITQHIGAYRAETAKGPITFLDTPGHEAFSAMRARGASSTDVVILVVAADDGVRPQTEEALRHIKTAETPMVVVLNKMDLENANPDRVRRELSNYGVLSEQWGGEVQFVEVSAATGQGIDTLLDAIMVQAELLELKAPVKGVAQGVVVESRIDRGKGVVSTLLVQSGCLKTGNVLVCGSTYGKVRSLENENGARIRSALPGTAVEVQGLGDFVDAGLIFNALDSEKQARRIAEHRAELEQEVQAAALEADTGATDEEFFTQISSAGELNIVFKSDTKGTAEAVERELEKLGNDEIKVKVVASGVGGLTKADVHLAQNASALMVGFHVRAEPDAAALAEQSGISLRYYSVIYALTEDIKGLMSGMLAPRYEENILGTAEVRDIFNSPRYGKVAGCMVIDGTVLRNQPIRVLRDNVVIYEGVLESLRHFQEDVNEIRFGTECGIAVKDYEDVGVGDRIEVFERKQLARTL
ncbi:MAG: translation initiation factor IF-2 [Gammaproteobacteria bacterium AqS3]|nr:translation initiation factor IF-2 [Gammaproteobacteria bacterium AqS3]